MKYSQAIRQSMNSAMFRPNTVIIGQGVTDFKGIWGTTVEANSKYPDRVIETPISEESTVGMAVGLALNGMYPINVHIRADFSLLAMNQIVNLAAKYRYMFGGLFEVPMLLRLVIGRSWGQGAQHSQSIQSLLSHIPGLVVIMPATPSTLVSSYKFAVENYKSPVISLEHRLLYELDIEEHDGGGESSVTIFGSRRDREGDALTLVATSVMLLESRRAADILAVHGVFVEIIDLHSTSHPDENLILGSITKTGRLLVADTSWERYGVMADICRMVATKAPECLKRPARFLGMPPAPCPTAKGLEDIFYPDVSDIVRTICEMMGLRPEKSGSIIPEKQSMTDYYKHFKGPF